MSWQEELRKLDEELAAGRLSADEYRVRRDQVLSSAVSVGDTSAGSSSSSPEQSGVDQSAEQDNHNTSSEQTQVVRPVNPQSSAESTQVVRNPNLADQHQSMGGWHAQPPHSQGNFQQAHPGSPPAGFNLPQQGAWNAPDTDMSPPWGGSDFPPIAPPTESEWARQGPETFETKPRTGKGKVIGIVAAVVAVVLAAATVTYFAAFNDSGTTAQTGSEPTAQASVPTSPEKTTPTIQTAGPLVIPRGQTPGPTTYSPEDLTESKALPEPDLVVLDEVGFTTARSVFVNNSGTTVTLWAFTTDKAQELKEAFTEDQERFGFEKVSGDVDGVRVYGATQQNSGKDVYAFRSHYVSDGKVIRVEAFNVDRGAAREVFDEVMTLQLQHNPSGR